MASLRELYRDARGRLRTTATYAPHFTPPVEMTTEEAMTGLKVMLDRVIAREKNLDAQAWLSECLREVAKANEAFSKGDYESGKAKLRNADDYLENAAARKSRRVDFIVGPSGDVHQNPLSRTERPEDN